MTVTIELKRLKKYLSEIHGYNVGQRQALEMANVLFDKEIKRLKEESKKESEEEDE